MCACVCVCLTTETLSVEYVLVELLLENNTAHSESPPAR